METSNEHLVLSLVTTVGSVDDAQRLATRILDERLAACVQVEPGLESLYRWRGALCKDSEVRLTVKSLPGHLAALEALFLQHHPYELPQFLATEMAASPAYARWVREEVADPPGG
ncbi:MAG: periplasmic divalent cation tolerance protein-like protein [Ramlibacter sp.]|nr:periplasmic divalent cation tolerance protein-like protein [Ramlibacter sp.]